MLMIYVFTALHKAGADWRADFTALQHALSIESLRTPLAAILVERIPSWSLKFGTWGALIWEELGPLLAVFLPQMSVWRTLVVMAMMVFHLSIALLFHLGQFQFVMISLWCAFLPTHFWLYLQKVFPRCLHCIASIRPERANNTSSILLSWSVAALVAYCLAWNVSTLPIQSFPPLPSLARVPGYALRLDQHWGLFAPNVRTSDGCVVATGIIKGREVTIDCYASRTVDTSMPQLLHSPYRSRYWREYVMALFARRQPRVIQAYADWLVKTWNASHKTEEISEIKVIFMQVDPRVPGHGIKPIQIFPPKAVGRDGLSIFHDYVSSH
jgi:hypothetical protein